MTDVKPMEPEYLVGHLRALLAREGELGIAVEIVRGEVFLSGVVATPERRVNLEATVARACPGCAVVNEISVSTPALPSPPELVE